MQKLTNKKYPRMAFTLAEGAAHANMSAKFGRCAFTLAEVLITLAIIGIVAAMTIPTLIQKYQEKVTVIKVKRVYSIINEALRLAIAQNGEADMWDFGGTSTRLCSAETNTKFFNYLRPYLRIAKDVGTSSEGLPTDVTYKYLSGKSYRNYYTDSLAYYKFFLADGSLLWLRTSFDCSKTDIVSNACGAIWFDINGIQEPNQFGKDTFVFYIQKDRIIPPSDNSCKPAKSGLSCSNDLLQNGNMDYLYE